MKAIEFEEVNLKVAEHQEEYVTLPVLHDPNKGTVTCCWELSDEEIGILKETKKIYHTQIIGNDKMQPIYTTVHKGEVIPKSPY